jgi:glycosyltransferase 2 family protein
MTRKQLLVRLSTVAGVVVAVAGAVFVGRKLAIGWTEYREVIADARWGWLLVALPLAAVGMASVGMVWRRIIIALGGEVSRPEIFVWYQLGQMAKYLPGGVWPMVGRSEMAVRGGLRRSRAYNSVALSMGSAYLCATLVSAALLPAVIIADDDLGGLWVFVLIPIGLLVLHPAVLGKVFRLAERVLGGAEEQQVPPWSESVKLVLRHTPSWLCIGLSTWFVALTFDPNAPLLHVVFAGVLSWVTGFVVVFVPGGLGVREAAFTAAAGGALDPEIAATVAVVSRLVFMSGDALGAAAAVAVRRRLAARSPDAVVDAPVV